MHDGIFSGKDPYIDISIFLESERNLKSPEFCLHWLECYLKSGGSFEIPGPCSWRDMPPAILMQVTDICMSNHVSGLMKKIGALH